MLVEALCFMPITVIRSVLMGYSRPTWLLTLTKRAGTTPYGFELLDVDEWRTIYSWVTPPGHAPHKCDWSSISPVHCHVKITEDALDVMLLGAIRDEAGSLAARGHCLFRLVPHLPAELIGFVSDLGSLTGRWPIKISAAFLERCRFRYGYPFQDKDQQVLIGAPDKHIHWHPRDPRSVLHLDEALTLHCKRDSDSGESIVWSTEAFMSYVKTYPGAPFSTWLGSCCGTGTKWSSCGIAITVSVGPEPFPKTQSFML